MTQKPKPPTFSDRKADFLHVDMSRDGAGRWQAVIAKESAAAKAITEEVWRLIWNDFPWYAKMFGGLTPGLFGWIYRSMGGAFRSELKAWAKVTGVSFGRTAMVNCAYELAQVGEFETISSGCTTGIVRLAGGGLVHVRTLDWPIDGLGAATRVFEFADGNRKFLGVGFPGAVGLLSGMVRGKYSVSINWAAPNSLPSFEMSPSFLLRKVLEECDTYHDAVDRLTRSKLCTSVYYIVCGCGDDEGCAIERHPNEANVRLLTNGVLAQANNYDDAGAFRSSNAVLEVLKRNDFLVRNSRERQCTLENMLAGFAGKAWPGEQVMFEALDCGDVTNHLTRQRILFRPKEGEIYLQTS